MTAADGKFQLTDFLYFMLRAIERVLEDLSGVTRDEFLAETKSGRQLRDAIVLNVGHMGEIAHDLELHFPTFVAANPQIPMPMIYAMRNKLFHGYHAINYEIVWSTCSEIIPGLAREVRTAIAAIEATQRSDP